jgi:rubredoxin
MKIFKQITNNWDNDQVGILRQFNIDAKEKGETDWFNIYRINLYDLNTYMQLKPFFEKWEVQDVLGTDFTKKEVLSADYCIIDRWNDYGYPMPDNDGSYLYKTYETKEMCPKCGVGKVQKDNFRVKKVPKYPIWGLGWIFDEFFVRTDLYQKIFKPLGIECRPLRKYKDDSIIESFVQLVIPVIDEPLDLTYYESWTCPMCGTTKYNAMTIGYYPLQEHPLPYIYKSKEIYGDGFSAYRKIFVSACLRDLMIENKMMGFRSFVPCAKADELSIKNQELMKWPKNIKTMGFDIGNLRIAIPE